MKAKDHTNPTRAIASITAPFVIDGMKIGSSIIGN